MWNIALRCLQYGCLAHCFTEYVGNIIVCTGPSMEPTIQSRDILLADHISPRLRKYNRGDVVISRSPADPQMLICKRIVAVAGEKYQDGFRPKYVPRGCVWLEGDNTDDSKDSRDFGPVSQALIKGRVMTKIWPRIESIN